MIYKLKDINGASYIIKDIEKFAKHIFEFHASGTSLHQENGHDFAVDDKFRKKILRLIEMKRKL